MRTEARTDVGLTPATTGPIPASRYWVFGAITLGGLAFDLGTKQWVFDTLGCPGQAAWEWCIPDLVRFRLHTNFNHGALWGLGQGWTGLFALLSGVAVFAILFVLFARQQARSKWLTVALAFVTAGALGNLYDRTGLHGFLDDKGQVVYAVRDFLYFRFFETFDWAIFNFADSFLVTGAIMLVIHSLFSEQPATTAAALPATASAGSPPPA
ncbi:MAG: signal peptidase II [Planctomycetaceae bacterium]|nr:signal peptidase II [Planctomycetaceae bacterium]